VINLTATPNNGSSFAGWSGACTGSGNCQLTLSEAKTITASFSTLSKPDFVVTAMTLSPKNPRRNRSFSAKVTVKNQGTSAGTVGSLGLWLNQPTTVTCGASPNKTATLGNLSAGASITYTFTGLSYAVAGNNTLRAFADRLCATTETQEGNNQMTKAYVIR
jgi:hypothetical protein